MLNTAQPVTAIIAQMSATVFGVRYMFETVDQNILFVGGRGLAESSKIACVRIGMMEKISPAVAATSIPSFHHI